MSKYKFKDIAFNSTEKKKPVEEDKYHYIGLEHLDSQCLKVNRYGSEVAPVGDKLIMKKGDVLFGKRRAYQKKVAIAPFDGIFSAHGFVLRPKEEVVDKDFFPFFISSDYFLDKAISISVGSLSPTINWTDLKDVEFELPDLQEQKRLAKILWKIEKTTTDIMLKKSNLKEIMNNCLNNEFKHCSHFELLNKVVNFEPKSKFPASFGLKYGDYRFFTSGNGVLFANEYMLDKKAVLVNDGGSALVRYYNGKFAFSDHTICLTENKANIKMEYIYYYLKMKEDDIDKNLFKGSGLKNIDKKAFKSYLVPIINIDDQIRLINKFSHLDEVENILINQYKTLCNIKTQILEEALHV